MNIHKEFLKLRAYLYVAALPLLVIGILFFPQRAHGVGVSPSVLEVKNLANGIRIEKTLNITRSDVSAPSKFTVSVSGEGARYVILPEDTLLIKEGERSAKYNFFIEPGTAPNGSYNAKFYFTGVPYSGVDAPEGESTVSIISGVIAHLVFTVTDEQIRDYVIQYVRMDDTEVGRPAGVSFLVRNHGNVDVRPTEIKIRLVDETDASHIIEETIPERGIPLTEPLTSKKQSAYITQRIPQGTYKGEVTFFEKGEVKYTENVRLSVHPPGTLAQEAEMLDFDVSAKYLEVGELLKIDASVKNTGNVVIEPVLYAEVKQGDKVIDLLRSDAKFIPKGETATYSLTFRPEKKGEYTIDVYFEYGIKQSEHKNVTLTVGSDVFLVQWAMRIGIGLLALLFLILIILIIKKILKRKKAVPGQIPHGVIPPVPPQVSPPMPASQVQSLGQQPPSFPSYTQAPVTSPPPSQQTLVPPPPAYAPQVPPMPAQMPVRTLPPQMPPAPILPTVPPMPSPLPQSPYDSQGGQA
ncbi:MAG: hypothetical protein ABII02_04075 [Candidatus Magasanikbacteria bacterium]